MKFWYTFLLLLCFVWACSPEPADLVILDGNIYTLNEDAPQAQAVAVRDGRILEVGTNEAIKAYISPATEVIHLEGKTLVPGFIESHGHILGLGQFKRQLDLTQVSNYDELVEMVKLAAEQTPEGTWILGRGWHQSKWTPQPELMVKGYQVHDKLSAVSPNHPVMLTHASGHAVFANQKAMEVAGITAQTKVGVDGEIIRDGSGRATGIFSEDAEALIARHIPKDTKESLRQDLNAAVAECLSYGITSFQDAGSNANGIEVYREAVAHDALGIRLWVMLSGSDSSLLNEWYQHGPEVGDHLTVRAIKLYADGALGSRGAWLLEEYKDRPGHFGNPLQPMANIQAIAENGLAHGFQVCTHAIGDRANREVLDRYEKAFAKHPEKAHDHRFRVEHAQHLHPEDIPRFSELDVIASMQGIHMSSDRPWAINRLGQLRIQLGAYMWQRLIQSGAKVINGTDTPVEPVNPFACYYASVTRKTLAGTPNEGYEADQKMTRMQALRSYTLDAAYGAFEEQKKGSIEVGKYADFAVLSKDIITCSEREILQTEALMTFVGGQLKYERKEATATI